MGSNDSMVCIALEIGLGCHRELFLCFCLLLWGGCLRRRVCFLKIYLHALGFLAAAAIPEVAWMVMQECFVHVLL